VNKLWIECQKCGDIFWVFSEELKTFYPKNTLDYKICSKCESVLNEKV
tara:strand:+ start:1806 stop:1949 length:144 start_codon:yes stop_codon:yes gene_type:complete